MHYILNDDYILRGWIDEPHGIVDTKNGEKHFFSYSDYQTLLQCDGKKNVDNHHQIEIFKKKKIIQESHKNEVIKENQKYKFYDCYSYQTVELVMTNRCNYNCRHCYLSSSAVNRKEFSTDDCLNIIDQLVDVGIFQIQLTGGECLLRKDFFRIADRIKQNSIAITDILSNGSIINDDVLLNFVNINMKPSFQISFDGTSGNHNWLRNSSNAEAKTIKGIKLLKKYGHPVFISMTMHKGNKDSLRETVLLLKELNIDHLYVGYVTELGRWIHENKVYSMIGYEYYDSFLAYLPYYKSDGMPVNIQLGGMFKYMKETGKYTIPMILNRKDKKNRKFVCDMSAEKIYISSDGLVFPCPLFTNTEVGRNMPNILSTSLTDILKDSNFVKYSKCTYDRLENEHSNCFNCKFLSECGGKCHIENWQNEPQFQIEKNLACTFFKKGYERKIQKIWNPN